MKAEEDKSFAEGYAAGVNMAMSLEAPTTKQTLQRLEDCLDLVTRTRNGFKTHTQRRRADGTIGALREAVQGIRSY